MTGCTRRSCTFGRLPCTVFLSGDCVAEVLRREVLRVLKRGESVSALKCAINAARVTGDPAMPHRQMHAVTDAVSPLAGRAMACNTMKRQGGVHRWNMRRSTAVPAERLGRIALP